MGEWNISSLNAFLNHQIYFLDQVLSDKGERAPVEDPTIRPLHTGVDSFLQLREGDDDLDNSKF